MTHSEFPSGSLVVTTTRTGAPTYRAKWRDRNGRQCAPTIGQAWLVRDGDGWKKRPGRVKPEYFDEARAYVRMAELIAEHDRDLDAGPVPQRRIVLFEELAMAWLEYLGRGERAKPSTLRDYKSMLATPGICAKGKRRRRARIMSAFAGRDAESITTAEVATFLDSLEVEGLAPKTVDKYRGTLSAMYRFAMRPGSFGFAENPVAATEKPRIAEPGVIETFTLDELEAIKDAALHGDHRTRPVGQAGPHVLAEWKRFNAQDAAIFMIAAFTGLRQGEIRALRWAHVNLDERLLTVEEAISAKERSTTKSRRYRIVPLTNRACEEFRAVASRKRWRGRNDLVFCGHGGGVLDGTELTKRFKRAQKAAAVRQRRFHDLRHTFGSTAVRRFDVVRVKEMMGHARLSTTERYLHSRPRADDAEQLAEAFESCREGSPQDKDQAACPPVRLSYGRRLRPSTPRGWVRVSAALSAPRQNR